MPFRSIFEGLWHIRVLLDRHNHDKSDYEALNSSAALGGAESSAGKGGTAADCASH